jgi:hypothetical protein
MRPNGGWNLLQLFATLIFSLDECFVFRPDKKLDFFLCIPFFFCLRQRFFGGDNKTRMHCNEREKQVEKGFNLVSLFSFRLSESYLHIMNTLLSWRSIGKYWRRLLFMMMQLKYIQPESLVFRRTSEFVLSGE